MKKYVIMNVCAGVSVGIIGTFGGILVGPETNPFAGFIFSVAIWVLGGIISHVLIKNLEILESSN